MPATERFPRRPGQPGDDCRKEDDLEPVGRMETGRLEALRDVPRAASAVRGWSEIAQST